MKTEWLLMTDAVREVLSTRWTSKPDKHENVISLLKALAIGHWRMKPEELGLRIWVAANGEIRYSAPVDEENTLIWETLNTFDVPKVIKRGREDALDSIDYITPHIILHQVKESSLDNVERIDLDGIDYQLDASGSISPLTDSDKDDLVYNRELHYLTPMHYDNILLGIQKGLWLHLTREQASILKRDPGPLLLSGEAGSGKTTIVTLWLFLNLLWVKDDEVPEKQLFVTFSERLKEKTEEDFSSMLDQKYITADNPEGIKVPEVEFKTYREILRGIAELGGFGNDYPEEKELDLPTFIDVYASRIIQEGLDPYLVWDEIRGVTKGKWKPDWEHTVITLEEYEKLNNRKEKCKIPYHLREKYWNASQRYDKYLSEEGLWDGIDLARRCYSEFVNGNMLAKYPLYGRLACDEVQDLSPIEIRLLIQILDDKIEREGGDRLDRLFLTGDKAQVINPSGFTWDTLKQILYEESWRSDVIRNPINLERNFRCTEEIVSLANQVIKSRDEMNLNRVAQEQTSMQTGEFPKIISENPLAVMQKLGRKGKVNPERRLIIVKTIEEKEKLIEQLGLENENDAGVPLTVEEAKGLEWHSSLLWNFFVARDKTQKNPWNYVFDEKQKGYYLKATEQSEKNRYTLEHEFNLLHVAITRSREEIYIYDEDPKLNFSKFNEIDEVTRPIDLDEFGELYKRGEARTPESLRKTAERLWLTNKLQSASLYLQAGKMFREKKDFNEAAECFALTTKLREITDSKIVKLPDLATRHGLAADSFFKCEDELNYLHHTAHFHTARKEYAKAAEYFTKHGFMCEKEKRWGMARKSFSGARNTFEKRLNDIRAAREATLDIARIYELEGKNPEAINEYKAAITYSRKLGDIKSAYDIISIVCKKHSGSIKADMVLLKAEIMAKEESDYRKAATEANTAYHIYKKAGATQGQKNSLRKAIQYSDSSDLFSIDYRLLLISLERANAPQICRMLWKEIIDYHIGNGDIADSWSVLNEMSTYLPEHNQGQSAIADLNKYGSEYSRRSSTREFLQSLERVREMLFDLNDFDRRCSVNMRLAKIHRDRKDQESARRFIEDAALDALRTEGIDRVERANKLFARCARWIEGDSGAGAAGFFCLQTVVYDYGLRDWDAEKDSRKLDHEIGIKVGINQIDFLEMWIEKAAGHYASAGKNKFKTLDSTISSYARRERTRDPEVEVRLETETQLKFCWTLYCKAIVISKKAPLSKQDYERIDSIIDRAIKLVIGASFKTERDFLTRQRESFKKKSQERVNEQVARESLDKYKRYVELALSDDGQIDEKEESWLAVARKNLGISNKEHKALVKEVSKELKIQEKDKPQKPKKRPRRRRRRPKSRKNKNKGRGVKG